MAVRAEASERACTKRRAWRRPVRLLFGVEFLILQYRATSIAYRADRRAIRRAEQQSG